MAYEVKGKTTKITAISRCAIKVKDNYYTMELSEERTIPDDVEIDLEKEYDDLFNSINAEIDKQCQDVLSSIKK